jgi:hypothetical protein
MLLIAPVPGPIFFCLGHSTSKSSKCLFLQHPWSPGQVKDGTPTTNCPYRNLTFSGSRMGERTSSFIRPNWRSQLVNGVLRTWFLPKPLRVGGTD